MNEISEFDILRIKRTAEDKKETILRIKRGQVENNSTILYIVRTTAWTQIGSFTHNGRATSPDLKENAPGNYAGCSGRMTVPDRYTKIRIVGESGWWDDNFSFRANCRFKTQVEEINVGNAGAIDTQEEAESIWSGASGILTLGEDRVLAWGTYGPFPENNTGAIKGKIYAR